MDARDLRSSILHLKAPHKPGLPSKNHYKSAQQVRGYATTTGQVLEALLLEATPNSTVLSTLQSTRASSRGLATRSDVFVQSITEYEARLVDAMPDEKYAEDVSKC